MRVFLRSAFTIALATALAMFLYVMFIATSVMWAGSHNTTQNADAIVVMGAAQYDGIPSPLLESRLAHALELWIAKRAPLIAVTGGKRVGDRFTEAATSRRWLTDRGVPASSIVSEESGTSTWQSLENLSPVLSQADVGSVIAVSSSWHVERVTLSLRELGFTASSSAPTGSTGREALTKTAKEVVGVAIGRIIGFGALFDITG
jgi:uncharacterized SAM-binding protein YcdF (DUF218 family)